MLPSNPAAAANDNDNDDNDMSGGVYSALNGEDHTAANSELIETAAQSCYTPVTDPDSIALLAAMHEANRSALFVAVLYHRLVLSVV